MTFESRKWLRFANVLRQEFQIRGAENRKARHPNDRLCRGINSWWVDNDERKVVVCWWCSKIDLLRYGGRPVCSALIVKATSLNCMCHSSESQWSCCCLRSAVEENEGRERWFTMTLANALFYKVVPLSAYSNLGKHDIMRLWETWCISQVLLYAS